MKTPRIHGTRTPRRRRAIFLGAAALALVLGATGVHAALQPESSTQARAHVSPVAPIPPAVTVDLASAGHPAPSPATAPSPTAEPTVDPAVEPAPDLTALADGVYPTFVRGVNVARARIRVDVLQAFFGAAMHRAAIEDGVAWKDVRYDPVYLRNENPLMRSLPVARDAHIKMIGVCEAPNRTIGLTQLRDEIWPFTEAYYYDLTVVGGSVERIDQLVAVAGC